jgi:hypothetical protein
LGLRRRNRERRRVRDPFPIRRDGCKHTVRAARGLISPVDPSRRRVTGMLNLSPPMFKPRPRRRRQIQTRSRPPLLEHLILPVNFLRFFYTCRKAHLVSYCTKRGFVALSFFFFI